MLRCTYMWLQPRFLIAVADPLLLSANEQYADAVVTGVLERRTGYDCDEKLLPGWSKHFWSGADVCMRFDQPLE
ncbi:uncharacterized protein BCR38DRAFT_422401 [Pseudomassariella vexata]|uniref:Uncharacterized protein n=1 Tax=Pseudomassariella vexata TaxID=1141098 RepID=A0A1Y2EA76_9PEZI|nr:uncharacterized protein BCR38DRAFT_422401 [Pseudomassariella vexata]ORY68204.1 hypothetical protein BCR38DRAFT_422401 [Pseudomassariella vexata]